MRLVRIPPLSMMRVSYQTVSAGTLSHQFIHQKLSHALSYMLTFLTIADEKSKDTIDNLPQQHNGVIAETIFENDEGASMHKK